MHVYRGKGEPNGVMGQLARRDNQELNAKEHGVKILWYLKPNRLTKQFVAQETSKSFTCMRWGKGLTAMLFDHGQSLQMTNIISLCN